MKKNITVIVAHPFQQHSFYTAAAVKNAGVLYKYVTTVYLKKGTLTSFLLRFLHGDNKKRANGRRTDALGDKDVKLVCEAANLLLLFLQRADKKKKIYYWWYDKVVAMFNKRLFRIVKNNKVDAVIVYDTLSASFIEKVKKEKLNTTVILDMSAPNAQFMKHIFMRESDTKGISISTEDMNVLNKKCLAAKRELAGADIFLDASDFTAKSLQWSGVDKNKIFKCIYGVYKKPHTDTMRIKNPDKIMCCVLGKISMQKGVHQLFDAIGKINRPDMEFHFYGKLPTDDSNFKCSCRQCFFHGHIPHDEMLLELKKYDIIIFPSLADGFGFSVTEALCENNIAICSENAGVSELIKNGVNGYVYNPTDENSLRDILQNIKKNEILLMQKQAPETISQYTWDRYNKNIEDMLSLIQK